MAPIRFGILGAAKIAGKFCNAADSVEGAEVVAVASKNLDRARLFAQENHVPSYYGQYETMLACNDIDVIYIATTNNFHYENILSCLHYGKHVLCEKSMVLTKKQAVTVFQLATDKKLFVMEAMWSRFLPSIQKARQWIVEGRIGDLCLTNASMGFTAEYNPANRFYNPDLGGGALYDVGVYVIEIMNYLVGKEILQTTSNMLFADTGVDKTDNITLIYDNCIANLQCSICAKTAQDFYLYGSKGSIVIPGFNKRNECSLYDLDDQLIETFQKDTSNGFVYEVEEVVRCIQTGKLESAVIPHKDTVYTADIFDRCFSDNTP